MLAWKSITPKVGGAILSASEGTKPRRHRLVSLVNITYKLVHMNVSEDNAIVLTQTGVRKKNSGHIWAQRRGCGFESPPPSRSL